MRQRLATDAAASRALGNLAVKASEQRNERALAYVADAIRRAAMSAANQVVPDPDAFIADAERSVSEQLIAEVHDARRRREDREELLVLMASMDLLGHPQPRRSERRPRPAQDEEERLIIMASMELLN